MAVLMKANPWKRDFHDFDTFLVGHDSDESATAAIEALGRHLDAKWGGNTTVYRTQGCVTFYRPVVRNPADWNPCLVQVVTRRYSTVGEVIHGFDMGSCAAAWAPGVIPETCVVTALGRLAIENCANVLNLVARRDSYEHRLAKYFERGYDLVLPDADPEKIAKNSGRLPYLYIHRLGSNADDAGASDAGYGSCGCCIFSHRLTATRPGWTNDGYPADAQGDRRREIDLMRSSSEYSVGTVPYGSAQSLLRKNIYAIVNDRPALLCGSAKYSAADFNLAEVNAVITQEAIQKAAEYDLGYPHGNPGVRLKGLGRLLGENLALELVAAYCREWGVPNPQLIARVCAERFRALEAKKDAWRIPFVFMGVQDGTALTGPFTRAVVTAADWYGDAYAA